MKPDDPPVNIKFDTKWSHFKETSKAKEPILLRWKSHRDFIQDVNCFLRVISFLAPKYSVLLPRVDVSLSRVIHTHRLPTAVPTTWKTHTLPRALLVKASHSSNAEDSAPDTMKGQPWVFIALVLAFPVCSHLLSTKLYSVYKWWRVLAFSSYWLLDPCIINLFHWRLQLAMKRKHCLLLYDSSSAGLCTSRGGLGVMGCVGGRSAIFHPVQKLKLLCLWQCACTWDQPHLPKEFNTVFTILWAFNKEHRLLLFLFYY